MYSVTNPPKKISRAYAQSVYGSVLPSVFNDSLTGHQLWEYISGDHISVVQSSNYFSNGGLLGMSAGDIVFVREVPEEDITTVTITAATPGGSATAENISSTTVLPYYHFQGFAGNQVPGDPAFYDISGNNNHGVFGANLSVTNAWANAGFVSTIDPVGGSTDSVIRIPAINYDYQGGEKLFVWWLGKVTDEGADSSIMGSGVSSTYKGIRVRTNGTNQAEITMYGATTGFGAQTTATVTDGTLHEFAFAFDGAARKFIYIVDGAIQASFSGDWANFNVGSTFDTSGMNPWTIGAAAPVAAASTDGTATQTRAIAIIRFPSTFPAPTATTLLNACKTLRSNPSKLLLASAF